MSWLKRFQNRRLSDWLAKPLVASSVEVLQNTAQASPFPPAPTPPPAQYPGGYSSSVACQGCGGYFLPSFVVQAVRVVIYDYKDRPKWMAPITNVEPTAYCRSCTPHGMLEVTLQTGHSLEPSDRRTFRIEDGFFEEVDSDGDVLLAVSLDEFDCTHCQQCGELIEENYCWEHRGTTAIKRPTLHRTPKKSGQ